MDEITCEISLVAYIILSIIIKSSFQRQQEHQTINHQPTAFNQQHSQLGTWQEQAR
jgi:hypothetical protein